MCVRPITLAALVLLLGIAFSCYPAGCSCHDDCPVNLTLCTLVGTGSCNHILFYRCDEGESHCVLWIDYDKPDCWERCTYDIYEDCPDPPYPCQEIKSYSRVCLY